MTNEENIFAAAVSFELFRPCCRPESSLCACTRNGAELPVAAGDVWLSDTCPKPRCWAQDGSLVWGRAAGVLGHGGGWALCSHNALQERFSWKYNLEITKLRQLVVTMALSVPGVYRKYQMFLRRGKFFTDTQSPRVRNWNCWLQTWWDLNWLNPEHGKDGWSCFLFNNCLCKQRNP